VVLVATQRTMMIRVNVCVPSSIKMVVKSPVQSEKVLSIQVVVAPPVSASALPPVSSARPPGHVDAFSAQRGTLVHEHAAATPPTCAAVDYERLAVFDADVVESRVGVLFKIHGASMFGCAALHCHSAQLHLHTSTSRFDPATVSVGSMAVADSTTVHGECAASNQDAASANEYSGSKSFVFVFRAKRVTIVDQHVNKRVRGIAHISPAHLSSAATRDGTPDHSECSSSTKFGDAACHTSTRPSRMAPADVEVDERDSGSEGVI